MGTKYIQMMVPADLAICESLVLAASERSGKLWREVAAMRNRGEMDDVKIEVAREFARLNDKAKDLAIQILDTVKASKVGGFDAPLQVECGVFKSEPPEGMPEGVAP